MAETTSLLVSLGFALALALSFLTPLVASFELHAGWYSAPELGHVWRSQPAPPIWDRTH